MTNKSSKYTFQKAGIWKNSVFSHKFCLKNDNTISQLIELFWKNWKNYFANHFVISVIFQDKFMKKCQIYLHQFTVVYDNEKQWTVSLRD